jgi:hypothetical protein
MRLLGVVRLGVECTTIFPGNFRGNPVEPMSWLDRKPERRFYDERFTI